MAEEDDGNLAIELDDTVPAASAADDVEVKGEIKIDTGDAPKGRNPDASAAAEAAADLRRQLDAEKERRLEEARRRERAEAEAAEARGTVEESHYSQIVSAMQSHQTALEQAKGALARAVSEGDGKTAADAQEAIANIVNRLQRLDDGKRELEARRGRQSTEGRVDPEPRQPQPLRQERPIDPVEAFLESVPDESARSWLRQHPECITDPRKRARMLAAHHEADADGIEISSPDYYAHLETKLGFRAKETRSEMKPEPKAAPAAPASRDRASGGRVTVRLSPEEQEAAQISGVTYEEYARNKLAMIKAGQLKG